MTLFYANGRYARLAPFFAIRRPWAPPENQKLGFFSKTLFFNLFLMKTKHKIKHKIEKKFLEQNGTFGELCVSDNSDNHVEFNIKNIQSRVK